MNRAKQDLHGLHMILQQGSGMISREYMMEKIKKICCGTIVFNPHIKIRMTPKNYATWIVTPSKSH